MSRAGRWLAPLLLLAAVAGWWLGRQAVQGAASTLSRGPAGWLAARAYLEARGEEVALLDAPLAGAVGEGVLVLGFPWQSRPLDVDPAALRRHLGRGGSLLIGYSGDHRPSAAEMLLLRSFGVGWEPVAAAVPLAPWRWYRQGRRDWQVRWAGDPGVTLELGRRRWLPTPPEGAVDLLHGPGGSTPGFALVVGRGRLVLLPAELLANGRLPQAAGVVETLRRWLDGPWRFDELHHGLVRPGAAVVGSTTRRGLDLLLAQLALVYLAAALALGRRMGPAWRERPPFAGGAAQFLVRLGQLHRRLGHHPAAAALLRRRAAELDRRLALPSELAQRPVRGDRQLLALAREVGRLQRRAPAEGGDAPARGMVRAEMPR